MKKLGFIALLLVSFYACKDSKKEVTVTEPSEEHVAQKTYAEISIAQGGEWVDGPRGHKEFANGTSFKNVNSIDVPKEHTDHSWYIRYEGPGWENSQVGYRLYLDWRNAIDIFGKKVDSMVLPYVGQDGFDSYHESSPWGQDILKAGKSMGIGGYGRLMNDTVAHFKLVKNTFAKVENSDDASTVHISYKDWKTGDDSIDLESKLTIYPHDRFTKAELTPSKEIAGICTGIVKLNDLPLQKKEGQKWAYIATYGAQTLVSETDKLGMAVFYKLDELAEQKEGEHDHLVVFKPNNNPITYYFLGAWEQEPNGIKTEADFFKDLDAKLQTLDNSNTL